MSQELQSPAGQHAIDVSNTTNFFAPGQPGGPPVQEQQPQPFGMLTPNNGFPLGPPAAVASRYYTIQRVNGNGGNGKGDGVAGPHKHSLEESDRVKRNSVQRTLVREEKEKKKTQVRVLIWLMFSNCKLWESCRGSSEKNAWGYVIVVNRRLGLCRA